MRDVGARDAIIVELAFPAAPGVVSQSFAVSDPRVRVGRAVSMWQVADAPTGKSQDENEMDSFHCRAVAAAGQFTAYIDSQFGPVAGPFRFAYVLR